MVWHSTPGPHLVMRGGGGHVWGADGIRSEVASRAGSTPTAPTCLSSRRSRACSSEDGPTCHPNVPRQSEATLPPVTARKKSCPPLSLLCHSFITPVTPRKMSLRSSPRCHGTATPPVTPVTLITLVTPLTCHSQEDELAGLHHAAVELRRLQSRGSVQALLDPGKAQPHRHLRQSSENVRFIPDFRPFL